MVKSIEGDSLLLGVGVTHLIKDVKPNPSKLSTSTVLILENLNS